MKIGSANGAGLGLPGGTAEARRLRFSLWHGLSILVATTWLRKQCTVSQSSNFGIGPSWNVHALHEQPKAH